LRDSGEANGPQTTSHQLFISQGHPEMWVGGGNGPEGFPRDGEKLLQLLRGADACIKVTLKLKLKLLSAQEEITWPKAGQASTERKLAINP